MKQTSENKLFNLIKRIDDKESSWIAWESTHSHEADEWKQSVQFLFLFASKARESGESKQSVSSDQFSESATNDALVVSLLQWYSSLMQWHIYSHRSIYQWIDLPHVHVQLVSLLQWQADSWSLRWASQLVSLLQWHSSSMQWHIYSHRSIYQWIDLPHVHVQLVSLLQWQVDSQSLWWASRLVSLLQWSFYFT